MFSPFPVGLVLYSVGYSLISVIGDMFPALYKNKDMLSLMAYPVSFAVLAFASVSMSLMGKGISIDGEDKDGEGITCSVDYLGELFKIEDKKATKKNK